MVELRAVFIGTGRLLIACAEQWTASGHTLHGVISDCPDVSTWARENQIPRLSVAEDQTAWLSRAPFDYLFSVINHAIIPSEVLALPRRRAINYHDAPLPHYSGFNATSWAIMEGAKQHGVTWHEMSDAVDSGGILVQKMIDITPNDTGFTLGVKCIEAGLESFTELLGLLSGEATSGRPMPVQTQGPRQDFHLRSDRPELGLIDLAQPASHSHALIRALDLGMDDNWMCRPKLALSDRMLVIGEAKITQSNGASAGEVLAMNTDSLTVATSDDALILRDLTDVSGSPVDLSSLGLQVGQTLAPELALVSDAAAAFDAKRSKSERFWVKRLASQHGPALAELIAHNGPATPAVDQRTLPANLGSVAPLAALATYLARTGEEAAFDVARHQSAQADHPSAYATALPLRLTPDLSATFTKLCQHVTDEQALQDKHVTYARDIRLRYQALRDIADQTDALTIGVRQADALALAPHQALVEGTHLTLVLGEPGQAFGWVYDQSAMSQVAFTAFADRIDTLLADVAAHPDHTLGDLQILPAPEQECLLTTWQDTAVPYDDTACIHTLFEAQVARTPDAAAIVFNDDSLTYRELDLRANQVAQRLQSEGIGPDDLVAICIERSLDLMIGLLGILKAGGGYVPLDPVYPRERLGLMLEDAKAKVVLTQRHLSSRLPTHGGAQIAIEDIAIDGSGARPASAVTSNNLAYVIFTSGSTGRPKGVMVEHRTVANFFTGMDQVIGTDPGVWLAVTSVSFDISVLELFWTLARGFKTVIQAESDRTSLVNGADDATAQVTATSQPMEFGLFYFSADQGSAEPGKAYRLLLEGARFADANGFSAVWTPERHFHEFGGLYPNPAVTTAALATITKNVALRAGSCVLPLHNPLRVAEDWAVIDQLSGGRVGLSFASGWHVNDFAFMPDNYERRREIMLESIEIVTKLWRGEEVTVPNGNGDPISVSVLPRPVQEKPPMWIAAAGSPDTFKMAGRIGANILTNMLGQNLDDLRDKFAAYRTARAEAGYDGPGNITVMLHTFVCEDTAKAKEIARKPFCDYLMSSFDLVKMAPTMFPAFRQPSRSGGDDLDTSAFTEEDMEALMDHAFDRYFETAGLFGSPENALAIVEKLKSIGASEVGCLIDFGVNPEIVLASLPHLNRLRQLANPAHEADLSETSSVAVDYTLAEQISRHSVTHMQCTPSMARLLISDPDGLASFRQLDHLLLGGEALPQDLVDQIQPVMTGQLHNMYGPTETTIWSTTSTITTDQPITIGHPIANTVIRILDRQGQLAPAGVAGELYIGGAGIVRGYLGQPELTAERFIADPYRPGERLYRTGDLARYTTGGALDFLGRLDYQVKVNGYRIELGEIETVLGRHNAVWQSVVSARHDNGTPQLVAYLKTTSDAASGSDSNHVARWQALWDDAYRQTETTNDPRFDISGWNDSYSGAPIATDQMREWLDQTAHNILALSPKRVLEIGCGTGMVLFATLAELDHYTGLDLSSHALETIAANLTHAERQKTTLLQQPAHRLDQISAETFDTVVINSVAQYFPDSAYLADVIARACDQVSDGGHIFLGDIRSRDHVDAFHTAVELHQAPGDLTSDAISARIDKRIAQDNELVVSESWFHALVRDLPRLTRVEINLKRGLASNEMIDFRYDVVLHVGGAAEAAVDLPPVNNTKTLAEIKTALADTPPVLWLTDLPNARLSGLYKVRAAMAQTVNADALRQTFAASDAEAINPGALVELDPDYDVTIVWARSGNPDLFDAILRHKSLGPARVQMPAPAHDQALATYTNQPAEQVTDRGALFDGLRTHLREVLPDYMIPSAFVVMDAFPLTPNGKIDRNALPAPGASIARSAEVYVAPTNQLEETIVDIWKDLLDIEKVGLRDNIFDLGANSLLTAQANQRLSQRLDRKISLVAMFRYPTIEALAGHLGGDTAAPGATSKRTEDREGRRKDAASRRRELRERRQGA